jgi:hypothetical protein
MNNISIRKQVDHILNDKIKRYAQAEYLKANPKMDLPNKKSKPYSIPQIAEDLVLMLREVWNNETTLKRLEEIASFSTCGQVFQDLHVKGLK